MYTKTTITLDALFEKSDGKKQHFRMKGFDPTKSPDRVKNALKKLTKLDIFKKDGVDLYKKVIEAKMTKVTDSYIFKEPKAKKPKKEEKDLGVALMEMVAAMGVSLDDSFDILETIQLPGDLTIIEERPDAEHLIQWIELPFGIDPMTLTDQQNTRVALSCLPEGATIEECYILNEAEPPILGVFSSVKPENDTLVEDSPQALAVLKNQSVSEALKQKPKSLNESYLQEISKEEKISAMLTDTLPSNEEKERGIADLSISSMIQPKAHLSADTSCVLDTGKEVATLMEDTGTIEKEHLFCAPLPNGPRQFTEKGPPDCQNVKKGRKRRRLIERLRKRE